MLIRDLKFSHQRRWRANFSGMLLRTETRTWLPTFGGPWCLHLQPLADQGLLTLKTEAGSSSEKWRLFTVKFPLRNYLRSFIVLTGQDHRSCPCSFSWCIMKTPHPHFVSSIRVFWVALSICPPCAEGKKGPVPFVFLLLCH